MDCSDTSNQRGLYLTDTKQNSVTWVWCDYMSPSPSMPLLSVCTCNGKIPQPRNANLKTSNDYQKYILFHSDTD